MCYAAKWQNAKWELVTFYNNIINNDTFIVNSNLTVVSLWKNNALLYKPFIQQFTPEDADDIYISV